VLGEAMAAGLPVVTTAVAAQPENVLEDRSGFVIPPGDAIALGRALRRLADDAALRHRMGQEGRAIAEARYDAAVNARRLTRVIEDGIERWNRRRTPDAARAAARRAA
jgi:glycosyltransferase involved in cell wall biosynthesis